MTSILEKIFQHKLKELAHAKRLKPLASLPIQSVPRPFIEALQQSTPAIIAEIKKASPSKGIIRADFDPAEIAEIYAANGASCLSVLTEEHFFHGHAEYIQLAKDRCELPVLRKDFIIDSYQIHESRSLGADCILLIVALLDDSQLKNFCDEAQALGMAVLVESHDAQELQRALQLPTPLIGINNRSLHSFETDLGTTIQLAKMIPQDKIIITESGIHSPEDIEHMQSYGIQHFLIGESLMKKPDIGMALRTLLRRS